MVFKTYSYCGIDCGKCEVLLANQNNTVEQLAIKRNIPPQQLKCRGCTSEITTEWCGNCTIKKCAQEKSIVRCHSDCNAYPCEEIMQHSNVPIFRADSYCGLYCGACELLIATQTNTLHELAEQREMNLDDLRCYGCKSGTTSTYCTQCTIKKCAQTKNVDFCHQCNEFPCRPIKEFQSDGHLHKKNIFQNLEAIKKTGMAQWLKSQKKEWSCPHCGAIRSYYQKMCKQCGAEK